jgi:hypothetical protein
MRLLAIRCVVPSIFIPCTAVQPSDMIGHTRELLLSPAYGEQEFKWLKMYGPVYLLKGCFGVRSSATTFHKLTVFQQNRLMISDPQAFQYILNGPHFALSPTQDNMTALVFGEGNLMRMRGTGLSTLVYAPADNAAGKSHKRLRNELNTAFTPATVRDSISIFEKVAQGVRCCGLDAVTYSNTHKCRSRLHFSWKPPTPHQ